MIRDKTSPDTKGFGPLDGITILDTGTVTAGPWAGSLAADFGAEVIKVESLTGDITRYAPPFLNGEDNQKIGTYWAQDGRNKLDITIDFTKPESKKVFAELIKISDIWIESSIPGTYAEKFGISDQWVFEINPKIVIVHISGYGQTGDPSYVNRPSYDMTGQAFSCYNHLNGYPDQEPLRIGPIINDFSTAVWALWSGLAAYINAQRTGKGQAVDVAQYEVMFRMIENYVLEYMTLGITKKRNGNASAYNLHPFSIYPTKDGWLAIAAGGVPFQRFMEVVPGLKGKPYKTVADQHKYGDDIKACLIDWLKDMTCEEADKILSDAKVACAPVMSIEKAAAHPHYLAREMFMSWEDPVGGKVTGYGLVPKFSETPGKVWRGAPRLGEDTEAILSYIGFGEEEINNLIQSGVVKKF